MRNFLSGSGQQIAQRCDPWMARNPWGEFHVCLSFMPEGFTNYGEVKAKHRVVVLMGTGKKIRDEDWDTGWT